VFTELQRTLDQHFHAPIDQLNALTQDSWQQTMQAARDGFRTRIIMSRIVFGTGIGLLVVSALLFLTGGMEGAALWGAGVSFTSGLGAMLLVVYTGPLRDVRQSVSDLGASSAAYIAFMHRILQISHTFSARYLAQDLSARDVQALSQLIDQALQATVRSLQFPEERPPA
jgi:hypothetical protein